MGSCCNVQGSESDRLGLHIASTCVALAATLAGWLLPAVGLQFLALPALILAYASAGWDASIRATQALRRRELDVDVLMLLAAAGAATVGHWLEGAVLLFLFSLGNTLETFAFRRTRRSIEALVELSPDEAVIVEGGEERAVAVETLRPGDTVRVRPGDRIPVDGDVIGGASAVDEATLTGEPVPVNKTPGDPVFAGTLNESGSLDISMTRPADQTALARIIAMVEEARESRAPTQTWIEEVEGRYAAGVILASGAAILIPWTLMGWSFDEAFYRAMTLLVVASPCALVISIPATIVSAVANGARHGILFKGGAHIDALADVTIFALDKTGTVTVGHPEVIAIQPSNSSSAETPDRLLALAAAAEHRSEHHLASSIVRAAETRDLTMADPGSFESFAGRGVEAEVDGLRVRVGKPSFINVEGARFDDSVSEALGAAHPTATQVHVAIDGVHAGGFAIQDHPRDGAAEAMDGLRASGIERILMLTGDAEATAQAVADEVGIPEIHAALAPDEKSQILKRTRSAGAIAMVGDGVNDAPALAVADVGIAMGLAGTDVALETADVVVMGEDLSNVGHAVRLSRRTRRIVRQNLVFSISMMIILVFAALMGWISLTIGVIGHEGSTVVVVFNGLRLLADGRSS
ncbi:MAG: cadmium-translocating P-type ATPase [Longimicrobiales bacterium]|nr:cadmium-translocating P-type ATPase [Longimicrobiales bacterium]